MISNHALDILRINFIWKANDGEISVNRLWTDHSSYRETCLTFGKCLRHHAFLVRDLFRKNFRNLPTFELLGLK